MAKSKNPLQTIAIVAVVIATATAIYYGVRARQQTTLAQDSQGIGVGIDLNIPQNG